MKPFAAQSYYELLEISVSASAAEIRAAGERLARIYADDQLALYGLATPETAAVLRTRLREAVEVLTDDELRQMYDEELGLPPREPGGEEPERQLEMGELLAVADRSMGSTHPQVSFTWSEPSPSPTGQSFAPSQLVVPPVAPAQPERSRVPVDPGPTSAPKQQRNPPSGVEGRGRSAEDSTASPFDAARGEPGVPPAEMASKAGGPARGEPGVLPGEMASEAGGPARGERGVLPAEIASRPGGPARGEPAEIGGEPVVPPGEMASDAARDQREERADGAGAGPISPPRRAEAEQLASEAAALSLLPRSSPSRAAAPRPLPEERPKLPDLPPDAEYNGELLRKVRTALGLSLGVVAERTRIGAKHLENVEADRYDALPATVYLRGILMSLAKELRLDGLKVARSYLSLVERIRSKG